MDIIKIHQPKLSKASYEYSASLSTEEYLMWKNIAFRAENPYLHWEELKRKDWLPDVSPEKTWGLIKFFRRTEDCPITDKDRHLFWWTKCAHFDEILHNFTHNLSGLMLGAPQMMNDKEKHQYITRGLIEEAIASSQLEGANTTRKYAKKMIQENIPPQDKGQRMIVNNYKTMEKIEAVYKHEKLSIALLHDIHKELTKNDTLDQGQSGKFRKDEDEIFINGPNNDGSVAFIPPDMSFVQTEIKRLIDFANDDLQGPFVHPVIKAIMLHFWIGYLHPYGDGNGRLARALFYWYLLRNGYWAFAFLPISEAIKKSPKQYGWAYIYSEQDDNDLTYFIDYNLRKILQAQRTFEAFIKRKEKEEKFIEKATITLDLNHRQLQIVRFLSTRNNETTNVSAIENIFGVSQMTAIRDLKDMMDKGYLTKRRKGKNVFYHPTEKLKNLIVSKT